jgi:hypothetical protein
VLAESAHPQFGRFSAKCPSASHNAVSWECDAAPSDSSPFSEWPVTRPDRDFSESRFLFGHSD